MIFERGLPCDVPGQVTHEDLAAGTGTGGEGAAARPAAAFAKASTTAGAADCGGGLPVLPVTRVCGKSVTAVSGGPMGFGGRMGSHGAAGRGWQGGGPCVRIT